MPASLHSITEKKGTARWSLLEIARPGLVPVPFGILFADQADRLLTRFQDPCCLTGLREPEEAVLEADILAALEDDLRHKGAEAGGRALLASLEDGASHFIRVSDSAAIRYNGLPELVVDRLFDEHVLGRSRVIEFVTHLPLYGLRAAATRFGELMEAAEDGWVRAPEKLRIDENMFVAQVVGRSMEPLIPDGSYCIFRANVTGSRQWRLVLVEKRDETELGARYTVKRYARQPARDEEAERTAKIRLEPLNREFDAFDLEADEFRVIAEFVQVLYSGETQPAETQSGEMQS